MRALAGVCFMLALALQPALGGTPPAALHLDPFYRKYVNAGGLPVVASAKVSDAALDTAADIVQQMLARRPGLLAALVAARVRVAVMAPDEVTTDIPEHRTLRPKAQWDARARGISATRGYLASSCAEENLLGLPGDRYRGESILVHEFAHTLHDLAIPDLHPGFDARLRRLYRGAMARGLWQRTYAASDAREYWAEGVQGWFDANRRAVPPDGIHNEIATREALTAYDPGLAELIAEVFGDVAWRWTPP